VPRHGRRSQQEVTRGGRRREQAETRGEREEGRGRGGRGTTTATTRSSSFPVVFVNGRGDGGAGNNDIPCRCPPPESLTTTRGQGGAYVPSWFVPAASSTGAGVKPTRRPLSNSFTPHWGGSRLQRCYREGGRCATRTPSPFQFIYPPNGGDFFS
jgi:hypothetical protein